MQKCGRKPENAILESWKDEKNSVESRKMHIFPAESWKQTPYSRPSREWYMTSVWHLRVGGLGVPPENFDNLLFKLCNLGHFWTNLWGHPLGTVCQSGEPSPHYPIWELGGLGVLPQKILKIYSSNGAIWAISEQNFEAILARLPYSILAAKGVIPVGTKSQKSKIPRSWIILVLPQEILKMYSSNGVIWVISEQNFWAILARSYAPGALFKI